MDKFEEVLEKMSEMSEKQLKTLIEMEKKRICICRDCSSFNQCMGENKDALFCILGKTNCKSEIVNCMCSECPAYAKFQMKHNSYCANGSEEEQRTKNSIEYHDMG